MDLERKSPDVMETNPHEPIKWQRHEAARSCRTPLRQFHMSYLIPWKQIHIKLANAVQENPQSQGEIETDPVKQFKMPKIQLT